MDKTERMVGFLLLALMVGQARSGAPVAAESVESDRRLHANGGFWGFKDDRSAAKPFSVLLIGDSIVGGYGELVKAAIAELANCDIWLTPAHLKSAGLLDQLRQIVSTEAYDAIHFNIGLHGWPEGRIPAGQYEPALRAYLAVIREEAPNAQLVWGSTTPIMSDTTPRKLDPVNNPTIVKRNAIAKRVMLENDVLINDLYEPMVRRLNLGIDKFHWNRVGKQAEAKAVEKAIASVLHSRGLRSLPVETVAYKEIEGNRLLLDVYRPDGDEKTPVLINLHGGAWVAGSKDYFTDVRLGQTLAKEGTAMVNLNYRLLARSGVMSADYDKAMADVSDAYAWVEHNAEAYHFDPERIAVSGTSAGGHLSSRFAQQEDNIKCYVGICGQYDLVDQGNSSFPNASQLERYGLGSESARKRASALHNVRPTPPVTLLMHGARDTVSTPNKRNASSGR